MPSQRVHLWIHRSLASKRNSAIRSPMKCIINTSLVPSTISLSTPVRISLLPSVNLRNQFGPYGHAYQSRNARSSLSHCSFYQPNKPWPAYLIHCSDICIGIQFLTSDLPTIYGIVDQFCMENQPSGVDGFHNWTSQHYCSTQLNTGSDGSQDIVWNTLEWEFFHIYWSFCTQL